MKENKENFADLLQEMGNKTTSEEHFQEMLGCLPPQLTNYEKGKGFNAFLVGEPYTHKFCRFAGKEVAVYACYATASDGTRLDVGNMSEAEFTKLFINNQLKKQLKQEKIMQLHATSGKFGQEREIINN